MQITIALKFSAALLLYKGSFPFIQTDGMRQIHQHGVESGLRTATIDDPMAILVLLLSTVCRLTLLSGGRTILRHLFSKLYRRKTMKIVEMTSCNMVSTWNLAKSSKHSLSFSSMFVSQDQNI